MVVVDRRGTAVVDSNPIPGDTSFASRPEIAAALAGQRRLGRAPLEHARPRPALRRRPRRLRREDPRRGARSPIRPRPLDRRVRRYWLTLAAIAGIVLAGVSLLGLWVARGVARAASRGVEEAAAADRRRAAGRPCARGGAGRGAPARPRVQRDGREARAAARVAAGVRRGRLARAADAADRAAPPAREHGRAAAAPALAEVERLGRLVEGAALACASGRAAARARSAVEVDAVLAERVGLWTESTGRASTGWSVRSSADRLGQIVDNLVANAPAVSDDGHRLGAARRANGSSCTSSTVAPACPRRSASRAFDRFWRGHAPGPGSGLGLAIVRRLAALPTAARRSCARRPAAGSTRSSGSAGLDPPDRLLYSDRVTRPTGFASVDRPEVWPRLRGEPRPERLDGAARLAPRRRAEDRRPAAQARPRAPSATCSSTGPRDYQRSVGESRIVDLFGEQEAVIVGEVRSVSLRRTRAPADGVEGDRRGRERLDPGGLVQPGLAGREAPARDARAAPRAAAAKRVRRPLLRPERRRPRPATWRRSTRPARRSRRRGSARWPTGRSGSSATCPTRCRPSLKQAETLPQRADALYALHRPRTLEEAETGRRRLAFDELLLLQLGLARRNREREQRGRAALGEPGELRRALPRRAARSS